jgi:hypothetical protein
MGSLGAETPYFDQADLGNVPNVIARGDLLSERIVPLGDDLPSFTVPGMLGLGSYTFGFSVDRGELPKGSFITAHLAPECDNDVIVQTFNPDIAIDKKTNGISASTPEEAVAVAPGEVITWSFDVINTGGVAYSAKDIQVIDPILGRAVAGPPGIAPNSLLLPGETWTYSLSGVAEDLLALDSENPILVGLQRVTIDFNTDAVGDPLAAGTIMTDQYAGLGLTISQIGRVGQPAFGAMIFDSFNPTGGDEDLRTTDKGNVLIISEDGNSANPDDAWFGGSFIFDFDYLVNDFQVTLLDMDEGDALIFGYRRGEDGSYQEVGRTTVEGRPGNDGLISEADLLTNAGGFDRIEIKLDGSGAVTDLQYEYLFPVFQNTAQVAINGLSGITALDSSHYYNGSLISSPLVETISLASSGLV